MHETSVWIAVNGTRRVTLACAAHHREALVLGHLIAEGWVDSAAGVLALVSADGPGGACGVQVTIDAARVDRVLALRQHVTEHGCGLRHTLDCEHHPAASIATSRVAATSAAQRASPAAATSSAQGASPAAATSHSHDTPDFDAPLLFRALFAATEEAAPDGGVHAAALTDGSSLLYLSADVARHCAVDRVIGLALLDGADLRTLGLLLTARVSGAMALKCARAGVPWVASRSIATSLAHELATAHGVRIHERAARRSADA